MQQKSTTRARHPSIAPVILDPAAPVSAQLHRRTAELLAAGAVRVHSVNGMDARERAAMHAAGVHLSRPRLVRATVGGHRVELRADSTGPAYRCDCLAASYHRLCCHALALAVWTVLDGGGAW